jgi:hypothetical protein
LTGIGATLLRWAWIKGQHEVKKAARASDKCREFRSGLYDQGFTAGITKQCN